MAKDIQQLDSIVISAPLHNKLVETAHPVNILQGEELKTKLSNSIGDTLKQELGVHSASFGAGVGQPVIRGQSGSRVKVLQNSLSSLDVSSLSPDHANSTEALLAKRIEVLRGPATLLYGSGAIGGIVNVIDNRIPSYIPENIQQTAIEQRFNTVSDEWSHVLAHDGGLEHIAWHVDGFFRERNNVSIDGSAVDQSLEMTDFNSRDYISNSDARSWSGTAGFSWVGEDGYIGFSANYLDNNYGIPPSDEAVRIDLQQARYDMKAEWRGPIDFFEALRLRVGVNDYEHAELESNGAAGTVFNNDAVEARMELVHHEFAFIDHGVFGFQVQTREFSAMGEEAFVPEADIHSYGFFTVEDIHFEDWIFEFGLRVEQQVIDAKGSSEKTHTPVSASISALYNLTEQASASLSFTHSQRAPDVQELYAQGVHFATRSYEQGDSQLKEETSYNLEFSLQAEYDWLRASLNLFHNWNENYITQINSGSFFDLANEVFQSNTCVECLPVMQTRQLDARFYGFESELTLPVMANSFGELDVTLFGDYVRGRLVNANDVPRMPPLRYGMQVSYKGFNAWNGNIRLTRGEKQHNAGQNETDTENYLRLDAMLSYKVNLAKTNELLIFAKGNNLLDEEIRNSTSFLRNFSPEPGRGAELGFRLSF